MFLKFKNSRKILTTNLELRQYIRCLEQFLIIYCRNTTKVIAHNNEQTNVSKNHQCLQENSPMQAGLVAQFE